MYTDLNCWNLKKEQVLLAKILVKKAKAEVDYDNPK